MKDADLSAVLPACRVRNADRAQASKTEDQLIDELGRLRHYDHLCLIQRASNTKKDIAEQKRGG